MSRSRLNIVIWALLAVLGTGLILSFFVDIGPVLYVLPVGMAVVLVLDWVSRQRRRS
jgi:hypothetical protein